MNSDLTSFPTQLTDCSSPPPCSRASMFSPSGKHHHRANDQYSNDLEYGDFYYDDDDHHVDDKADDDYVDHGDNDGVASLY